MRERGSCGGGGERTEERDGGGYGEGEWRRGKRELLVALFKRHHSRHEFSLFLSLSENKTMKRG